MKTVLFILMLFPLASCNSETGGKRPKFLEQYNVEVPLQNFRSANPKIQLQRGNACKPANVQKYQCKNYWTGPYGINAYWGKKEVNIFTKGKDETINFIQVLNTNNTPDSLSISSPSSSLKSMAKL